MKRILAYSSIAHSGYMLVGVIAGPGDGKSVTHNGLAAVLFYLLCYGVMTVGAFGVLACLERRGKDGEATKSRPWTTCAGLCKTHPTLGWTMVLCSLSLMGFPPLLGFLGKLPLFTSIISAGDIALAVVLGLNSAIAAFYYLRLAWAATCRSRSSAPCRRTPTPFFSRPLAAMISAIGVVLLLVVGNTLLESSNAAAKQNSGAKTRLVVPPATGH